MMLLAIKLLKYKVIRVSETSLIHDVRNLSERVNKDFNATAATGGNIASVELESA